MSTSPTAFANLENVLNRARTCINDAYNGGAGEILTDTSPFTLSYVNGALQELQDRLGNNGDVTLMIDNFIVSGLEPISGVDPSVQTSLSVNGYSYNGNLDATKALPVDLYIPQKLWERQTGTNLPFRPMSQPMEGLPSAWQGPYLNQWEWRDNAIWFRGALTAIDVRIRYLRNEASVPAGSDYANVSVDLPGAANALAYLIAYYYDETRSPENAAIFMQRAEYHITQMIKRLVRQKQGVEYHRRPYGDNHQHGRVGDSRIF